MVTTKDKLEFFYAMAKHSKLTRNDCQRVLRYAATCQRLAKAACNRELTKQEILKDEKCMAKIIEICAPLDVEPQFSGDPRGCVVKLAVPDGYSNSFGGEGICVPA